MLRSLVPQLLCPTCLDQRSALLVHAIAERSDGHIQDGVLICDGCKTWYPVEDDLLELVPRPLLNPEHLAQFHSRFRQQLQDRSLCLSIQDGKAARSEGGDDFSAQLKQREHFDWYADSSQQSYADYQHSPFWTAVDEQTFAQWRIKLTPQSWLLDVGCADGRSTFPFVDGPSTLVGFDISKRMIRNAIDRARSLGVAGRTTFFVSDGHNLPFRDESFNFVVIYGVLHHLPDPGRTCRDVCRILKRGGVYFGSENNRSMFRGIFDLLMKMLPLWTEEAGAEPLISRQMILKWTRQMPVRIQFLTSVFMPPHLFNVIGKRPSRRLLSITDCFFSVIPVLKNQGGLIIFEMHKL